MIKKSCMLYSEEDEKQALNQRLVPKKVQGRKKINQETWLKPYIDMSSKLKAEAKSYFEKEFLAIQFLEKQCKTLESSELLDL